MTAGEMQSQMEILAQHPHETGFALEGRVPERLLFFDGHFRQAPVLAGVVQIYWVMEQLSAHLGERPGFHGLEAVKFHQLMFPGEVFQLVVSPNAQRTKWSYQITAMGRKIASGRILVTAETEASA